MVIVISAESKEQSGINNLYVCSIYIYMLYVCICRKEEKEKGSLMTDSRVRIKSINSRVEEVLNHRHRHSP